MAAENESVVWVKIVHTQGSAPREEGAWMLVGTDTLEGTIGGGHLEWQAMGHARAMLAGPGVQEEKTWTLGPNLGQCCGGVVTARFEKMLRSTWRANLQAMQQAWPLIAIFGAGHVGRAIVQLLLPLPVRVAWFDSREDAFSLHGSSQLSCEMVNIEAHAHHAVEALPAQTMVVIMTHSHHEDFLLVQACLQRQRQQADLRWIGLIGSKTKWNRFRHRLQERGFPDRLMDSLECPIAPDAQPAAFAKHPQILAINTVKKLSTMFI